MGNQMSHAKETVKVEVLQPVVRHGQNYAPGSFFWCTPRYAKGRHVTRWLGKGAVRLHLITEPPHA